jgi:hypothetical protein
MPIVGVAAAALIRWKRQRQEKKASEAQQETVCEVAVRPLA